MPSRSIRKRVHNLVGYDRVELSPPAAFSGPARGTVPLIPYINLYKTSLAYQLVWEPIRTEFRLLR